MAQSTDNFLIARARVDAAATPAWFNRQGFTGSAPLRSGAGVYLLTLHEGVDSTKINVQLTLESATSVKGSCNLEIVSDTQIRVKTFEDGVAADIDFHVLVTRIP